MSILWLLSLLENMGMSLIPLGCLGAAKLASPLTGFGTLERWPYLTLLAELGRAGPEPHLDSTVETGRGRGGAGGPA